MQVVNFAQLADQLDTAPSGKTLSQRDGEQRMQALIEKVLEAVSRPQPAPLVNVPAANITVQPSDVVVHFPPPSAPFAWKCTFERNADGTIQSIILNPC